MTIVWSPEAAGALEFIEEVWTARTGTISAERMVRRLVDAVETLETFPEIGRMVTGPNLRQFRELIVHPYRVFYRLHSGVIEIEAIVHGRRDIRF